MKRLEAFIAIFAFLVSILVAFGIYHLIHRSAPELKVQSCPPVPEMTEVIVANKLINTGEPLADFVTFEKWPQSSVRPGTYTRKMISSEQLKEFIARRVISPGEPLTQNSIVDRKDRSVLSALVGKDLRAVSISLDPNGNIGGLLSPGDIVDVILALNAPDKNSEDGNRTILCGIKVLALDQHFSNALDLAAKKASEAGQPPKTVTLEVTPNQASLLISGMKLGTLSLSLHSSSEGKNQCVAVPLKMLDRVQVMRADSNQTTPQQSR